MKQTSYLAEVIGTFGLVFAGTGAIIVDDITGQVGHVGVSLVFGFIVLVMVYSLSHISGAHINPAVTIGFASVGKFPRKEVPPYIMAQLIGASVASGLWFVLIDGAFQTEYGITLPHPSFGWKPAFVLEVVLTFFLMFVIMAVATDRRVPEEVGGLAIGLTVGLDALFGGPITGASMNPARSFAPALVASNFSFHWIYWIAPILGAILAASIYEYFLAWEPQRKEDIYGVVGKIS